MVFDSNSVIAIATSVYGAATLLLVFQLWRDRTQREKHFAHENEARKLNELHSAFYEAWGYWEASRSGGGAIKLDASQLGKIFEALIRLECQLRLNGYKAEANNLGFSMRADFDDIRKQIDAVGLALGLISSEYRRATALQAPASQDR